MSTEGAFVGRARELAELDAYLEGALAGAGSVCFVSGEAGAGKTALLTEFTRRARVRYPGLVVVVGECDAQTGSGDPYLPFREVLGTLTGQAGPRQSPLTGSDAARLQEVVRVAADVLAEKGPDLEGIFMVPAAGQRLAAVWFADIVGYTLLSSRDEPAALALVALLQEIARERTVAGGGRVVKFLGDAAMAEFGSAAGAVYAAVELAREFAARSASQCVPSTLRVGVHLGDVTGAADGDIYGAGVNLAARLQGAARPGQVLVSENVWRQLQQRPEFRFTDEGHRELKGVAAPLHVYGADATEGARPTPAQPAARTAGARPAGMDQSHVFEQFTNVLRGLAEHAPLVVVLDDLHWADSASVDLLFHLARRLGEGRVLLVGAYRANDVALGRGGERHPLEALLNELKRCFGEVVVDLDRAGQADGRRLVDALVDREPNHLGTAFRDALFRHTGGHPLFTVELLSSLRERGDLVRDERGQWVEGPALRWDELPARAEGVIAERIGRLEAELREMLTVASVEGEEFTAEVVARVRQIGERDAVRHLSGELDRQHRLVGTQGVRRRGSQRLSQYRFRHSLFQKYLYHTLDEVERSYLHEDVGRVLEALYGSDADEVAVQLARHFEEAGDAARAVGYRIRAGERARHQFANRDAIGHFRRALDLLGEGPDPEGVRPPLLESLGDVLEITGKHDEARAAYQQVALLPDDRIGRARLQRKIGRSWEPLHRRDEAMRAYETAEAVLGDEPEDGAPGWWEEWVQVQLDRCWSLYVANLADDLSAVIQRVQPQVERHGTPGQRARLLWSFPLLALRRDRYRVSAATLEHSRAYLQAAEAWGDPGEIANARFGHGFCLLWSGALQEAEAVLNLSQKYADRAGDVRLQTLVLTYLTFLARMRGDTEALGREAARAQVAATEARMPVYLAAARANLACAAWRRGDGAGALLHGRAAVEEWRQTSMAYPFHWAALWPLIAASLDAGDLAAAIEYARELDEPAQQPMSDELTELVAGAMRARDSGDRDAAAAGLRQAVQLATQTGHL